MRAYNKKKKPNHTYKVKYKKPKRKITIIEGTLLKGCNCKKLTLFNWKLSERDIKKYSRDESLD